MSMLSKTALLSLLLLILASGLMGAYLTFQPVDVSQPDGTKLSLFASGDEYYNWLHDRDGYTVKQNPQGWYVFMELKDRQLDFTPLIAGRDNPAQRNIAPWTNIPAEDMGQKRLARQSQIQDIGGDRIPHSGTLNNLVIFIRFSNQTEFSRELSYYNGMFNGAGNTLQAYFLEASYNALNIATSLYPTTTTTTVVSWQSANIRGYYSPYNATTNPTGYQNETARTSREHALLVSAVNGISAQIPVSLNLDGDNDGKVDNVCFVVKGSTDGWAELLWPHRWSLYSQFVYINSKRVYDYNFQLADFMDSSGNGVLCHEMFHSLGAPDLYHYSSDGMTPVGGWDLMESNSNPPEHMGAYMKWKYVGWISSIPVASETGTYTLNPLTSSTNNCYRINSPNSTSEYFVVEFRKKTGQFESSVPNSGMIIYRINTAATGNAGGPPDEVYVFRPGGTATSNGNVSSAHFSEEANRIIFNSYTNPYPFLNSGSAGGISIRQISSSAGETMNFTLASGDPLAQLNEGFENGIPTGWSYQGSTNWVSDTATFFSGAKSLKSGAIAHSQTTTLVTNSLGMKAGQVSFFLKTSTQSNYDWLIFFIDGVQKGQWTGETPWSLVAYNVTRGYHTLKWQYMKDSAIVAGSDCVWIDHLAYPAPTYNPPRNLIAAAGHATVNMSWLAPSDGVPVGYKVYRNGIYLAATTALSYISNNLVNGTAYSYYITAIYSNPSGNSAASNTVMVTPASLPPLNLTGTFSNAFVTLNWTAPEVTAPVSYNIYRNNVWLTSVPGLTYIDNSVNNTLTYSYALTAVYANPAGESAPTFPLILTGNGLINIPSLVISRSNAVSHRLDWTAISGATQYKVYRSLSPTTGFVLLNTVSVNYLLVANGNARYFYKVAAVYP